MGWQQVPHLSDHDQPRPGDRLRQGDTVLYRKAGIVSAVDDKSWHADFSKPLRPAGCVNGRLNVVDRSRRGLWRRPVPVANNRGK